MEPVGEQAVGNVGSKEVYGGDLAYRKFGTSTTSEQIKMPIFAAKRATVQCLESSHRERRLQV